MRLKDYQYKNNNPNIWTILQIRHFFYNHKRGVPNYIWKEKKDENPKKEKEN